MRALQCARLSHLEVSSPYITTSFLKRFEKSSLTHLALREVKLVDCLDFRGLKLTNLQLISCWHIDGHLSSLPLQSLTIVNTGWIDNRFMMSSLATLQNVEYLHVQKVFISNQILLSLSHSCPKLVSLNVFQTKIRAKGLKFLSTLPLKELYLQDIRVGLKNIQLFNRKSLCTIHLPLRGFLQSAREEFLTYHVKIVREDPNEGYLLLSEGSSFSSI
jgi:hypothetical protein